MATLLCALQQLGPALQVADIVLAEVAQLAIKILASAMVVWFSYTELLQEVRKYRAARLQGV